MADEMELNPREKRESGEGKELDDPAYEPLAHIEQAGDYRQAEEIQNGFAALMDNTAGLTVGTTGGAESKEQTGTAFREMRTERAEASTGGPWELDKAGFAAVVAYMSGSHEAGGGHGNAGSLGAQSGAGEGTAFGNSGNNGLGSNTNFAEDKPDSAGKTPGEVWQDFTDYCRDAYNNGDRPADGDVDGWIADKGKEYFGNVPGAGDLLNLWKELADKNRLESKKTCVTREGEGDSGGGDEPGSGGGSGADEPGMDDDKGGTSSESDDDDDDDDDGDDDDDDDDGDDDGGGDEDGGDDGGDDVEMGEGGDDTGHGRGVILKGGSSKGEKDDTGRRFGILGGGSESGGRIQGEGGEDDTGKKGGIFGGPDLHPDSGGALPIDPVGPAGNVTKTAGENLDAQKLGKQTGKK